MGLTLAHSRISPLPSAANGTTQWAALTTQAGRREGTEARATRTFRTGFTAGPMYYRVRTNPKDGASVFTVRKNGANTAVAVTVGAGSTGEFEDLDTVAFAANDTGAISMDITASTSGDNMLGYMHVVCDYGSETVVIPMATGGANATASATEYVPLIHLTDWGEKSLTDCRTRINYGFTARNFQGYVHTNSRTTSTTCSPVLDGTNVASLEFTIGSGATGEFEDLTGSEAVTSGSDWNWRETTGTGTELIEMGQVSCEFVSAVEGEFLYAVGSQVPSQEYAPGPGVTEYWHLGGSYREADTPASEAVARHNVGIQLQLDRFTVYLLTNGITAASTVTLRKNGSSTGIAVTLTASTAGRFEDLVSSPVLFLATDEAATQWATGGSGTTMTVLRSMFVASLIPLDNDRLADMAFCRGRLPFGPGRLPAPDGTIS